MGGRGQNTGLRKVTKGMLGQMKSSCGVTSKGHPRARDTQCSAQGCWFLEWKARLFSTHTSIKSPVLMNDLCGCLGVFLRGMEEEGKGPQKAVACVSETIRSRAETGCVKEGTWKHMRPRDITSPEIAEVPGRLWASQGHQVGL